MVRRFDVYCNGGWDGCTTYEEDCDCGDYVSAVDYAELVEAVRWEREFDEVLVWLVQTGRYPKDTVGREVLFAELECARAAVNALVGER